MSTRAGPIRGLQIAAVALLAGAPAGQPLLGQECGEVGQLVVRAEAATITLQAGQSPRLPYGYELQVFSKAPALNVRTGSVTYEYTGNKAGDRRGTVALEQQTADCWTARLPKLRLNEAGQFTTTFLLEPTAKAGVMRPVRAVLLRFVEELRAIPANVAVSDRAASAASAAADSVFENASDLVVSGAEPQAATRFVDSLARLGTTDLRIFNSYGRIRNAATYLRDRLKQEEVEVPGVSDSVRLQAFCGTAATLRTLQTRLDGIARADDSALTSMILDRKLPLDPCVNNLLDSARRAWKRPQNAGQNWQPPLQPGLADGLIQLPGLEVLFALENSISRLVASSVTAKTINVPFDAAVLERYTQVDMVEAWVPEVHMLQTFSAVTWYAWSEGSRGHIDPGSFSDSRVGFQFGYPVGDPLKGDPAEFSPTLLAGVILRFNRQLSVTVGAVVGRRTETDSTSMASTVRTKPLPFVSLNLDLTSFTPFQMIFARKD